MNEQIIDTVDDQATISVEMPGSLFIRLNQLLTSGLKAKDHNELLASVNRVKANETDKQNSLDYHVETVLLINGLISSAAVAQKKIKPYVIKLADTSTKTS